MSDQLQQQASKLAAQTVNSSNLFEEWVKKFPDVVTTGADELKQFISSTRRHARTIDRACSRPASIAVFGESQVGKSYLVSTLAKGANSLVQIRFVNETRNFVTELNPEGKEESTGLVTRFSVKSPPAGHAQKPIYVELLSELDVVKIFVNTFYNDIKHKHTKALSSEVAEQVINSVGQSVGTAGAAHFISDDVVALQEFFWSEIDTRGNLKVLGAGFWRELESLLPRLSVDDRLRVYSLFWLQQPDITMACAKLVKTLQNLDHCEALIVGMEAMSPRKTSIIDVRTLNRFFKDETDHLEVETPGNGQISTIGRATLCALTAEVYLMLDSPVEGALSQCDLLDFPGMRGRMGAISVENVIESNIDGKIDGLSQLYRRGKVDVLFKRYSANRELAALLLCRQPGNQEAHELKSTVYDWISMTLGNNPGKRNVNTLFVLFTKFDLLISPTIGEGTKASTLSGQIDNTFVSYFNQNTKDNWPTKWNADGVFKNCHWYRNPFAAQSPLFVYDKANPIMNFEVDINSEQTDRIAKFRETFLGTPDLNQYFTDPAQAWDSVMGIQDGGVSYIQKRLDETVNPNTKFELLLGRINDLADKLKSRMDEHHISSDLEAERRKRKERMTTIITSVLQHVIGNAQFGVMLQQFQITPAAIIFSLRQALSNQTSPDGGTDANRGQQKIDMQDFLGAVLGDDAKTTTTQTVDIVDTAANEIMQQWTTHIRSALGSSNSIVQRLSLPDQDASNLTDEIVKIAQHTGIEKKIAQFIRDWRRGGQEQMQGYHLLSRRIASEFNNFIFYFGYDTQREKDRPQLRNSDLRLYSRPVQIDNEFEVSETSGNFNIALYKSWATAFVERVEASANDHSGPKFNQEANQSLEDILLQLQQAR